MQDKVFLVEPVAGITELVISTEAQRSGDLRFAYPSTVASGHHNPPLCHLDPKRTNVEWTAQVSKARPGPPTQSLEVTV
jgi:hypothetical protein